MSSDKEKQGYILKATIESSSVDEIFEFLNKIRASLKAADLPSIETGEIMWELRQYEKPKVKDKQKQIGCGLEYL